MYEAGLEAVFVKVAALGLVPKKHLGKTLRQMEPVLHRLHRCAPYGFWGRGGGHTRTRVGGCDAPPIRWLLPWKPGTPVVRRAKLF
jgi:hypothetical protein